MSKDDSEISLPDDLSLSDLDVELSDEDTTVECLTDSKDATSKLKECISNLTDKLKLVLHKKWSVDVVEDSTVRLMNINCSKNAAVEKCIFLDVSEGSVGIFAHGVPVSRENTIFDCQVQPERSNIGSISDYLNELVSKVELSGICQGTTEHENLWDFSKGFLDFQYSDKSPYFRSSDCEVLIEEKRKLCRSCQVELKRLKREENSREKQEDNPSNTPDKYLSKKGLTIKKDRYRKTAKKEKLRADRLQRRVDTLQIKLDDLMKDELSSILRANQHRMSDLQKVFWEAQLKALALDDKRGMRWHPMLIRLALHLHSLSDGAYQFWNEIEVLALPSSRRLFDYSHFVDAKEGCQPELIQLLRDKLKKCGSEEHFSYVNLMLDEMHIRSGLVLKRSTGEIIGYTKLDGVDEELRKMQYELESKVYQPKLAKKVLVYLARGITSNLKDVVAVHTTDDLSVNELYDHTWDTIYNLEVAGIKVLTVTCDGASVNRKFILMHASLDKNSKYCYSTKNLASGDFRPLFFILDPPHLLKTIRNALANSFSHRKTRKLWKNHEYLSWKVIEKLYELTKNRKFTGHKLTKAHIKLTSFSCMTVRYATQVFSLSVANCIEEISTHEGMKIFDTSELISFIKLMNKFFDCVNGEGEEDPNSDKAPYCDPNDARILFLQNDLLNYFEEWKEDVINRPGIYTDSEKNNMIISHQALGALQITVKGLVGAIKFMLEVANAPSVSARRFNQDSLEQYFGQMRRKHGDNRNPSVKAVLDSRLNIQAQGHISLPSSSKGNTEVEKRRTLKVDSTTLPSRKNPRDL